MSSTTRCIARVVLTAGLVAGVASSVLGQGAGASIVGVIRDAQGGVLPGCTVTLRNQDSGFTRSAVTDGAGRYQFAALPVGRYALKSELTGFTTMNVTDLVLTAWPMNVVSA
jgi:hypothetical protein